MKDIRRKPILVLLLLLLVFLPIHAGESLEDFLKELPLKNIRVLEKEAFYSNIYEIYFEQPLDHANPDAGTFTQRLYISHIDKNMPVVLVTEGYDASYYYTSEPATILKCNQIIAEHRFFGQSKPDSLEWEYLTTWQSASDHHCIIEAFSKYYTGKWITTGISKGGQTVLFHSFYYPDDSDARIPYVAPLNNNVEDQRIYSFLDKVGNRTCRNRIHRFQKWALRHEEILIPEFKAFSEKKGYTYEEVGGYEKAFEYCVLEYSFAFWQWGYATCSEIPVRDGNPEDVIRHMNTVGGFDYFADEFVREYRPFFYQAYTEMGYYGYDLDEFRCCLNYVTDPGFSFTLPENVNHSFQGDLLLKVDNYVKKDAKNFIFIYGEYDTWSATAVDPGNNPGCYVFYKKKGSHRTRIKNMSENQQEEITRLLKEIIG